jgi:putative addiction module component (TIGR02574 family)
METASSLEALRQTALQLQPDARIQLAHMLVQSLSDLPEAELAALWLAEAERRDEEMESGQVQEIDGDEVFARIQARYGT